MYIHWNERGRLYPAKFSHVTDSWSSVFTFFRRIVKRPGDCTEVRDIMESLLLLVHVFSIDIQVMDTGNI